MTNIMQIAVIAFIYSIISYNNDVTACCNKLSKLITIANSSIPTDS